MIRKIYTLISLLRLPYKDIEYLNTLRAVRLKKLLIHAKNNVSFYRDKFLNIELESIQSLEDLRFLPIIKPIELREEKITNITAANREESELLLQRTSGTTGMPFKFYNSKEEDILRQLMLLRFLYQLGWKPWWKYLGVWGRPRWKNDTFFQRLINKRKYILSVYVSLEEQAQQILNIKPQLIIGMADHLKVLANWMLENNIYFKDLKLIITSGARFSSDLSEVLQNVFGRSGIDMYGFEEGGIIGGKCPHCNRNYFADDSFIIEVLDENDAPVKPGEKGRAVITNLDQFTTPIIRYDIGDFITLSSKEVNCKNKFTHWVSIDGREADTLTLKNGRIITNPNISSIKSIAGIKQYQFFQKSNGELVIRYVRECSVDKKEIEKSVLEKMGLEDYREVSFEECNSIPLEPTGKFKTLKKEA